MMTGRIVIVGYKPKKGKQAELEALVKSHIPTLRAEGLISNRDAISMRSEDGTIIEVFEWASKDSIEKAHSNVKIREMWVSFSEVCDYVPVSQVKEISSVFSEFTPLS